MPERPSIDTLRGLACLLLVAFHVVGEGPGSGLQLDHAHLASRLNDWASVLRMPLFSVLSGLVWSLRPGPPDLAGVAVRKARRLLVPMLLVGTAFAVAQSAATDGHARALDWWRLHFVPVGHYWFLEALFWVFLAATLLQRAGLLSTPARLAGTWVAAAALQLAAPLPVALGLEGATYLLPFFLLGTAVQRRPSTLLSGRAAGAAAGLLAAAVLALCARPDQRLAQSQTPAELLASVACCLLLLHLRPRLAGLAWIGRWSFGIYLFHVLFSAGVRLGLHHLGITSLPWVFGAGLLAGIAGPIALTAALRRLPWGHWVLGERRSGGTQARPLHAASAA